MRYRNPPIDATPPFPIVARFERMNPRAPKAACRGTDVTAMPRPSGFGPNGLLDTQSPAPRGLLDISGFDTDIDSKWLHRASACNGWKQCCRHGC